MSDTTYMGASQYFSMYGTLATPSGLLAFDGRFRQKNSRIQGNLNVIGSGLDVPIDGLLMLESQFRVLDINSTQRRILVFKSNILDHAFIYRLEQPGLGPVIGPFEGVAFSRPSELDLETPIPYRFLEPAESVASPLSAELFWQPEEQGSYFRIRG